MSKRKSTTEQLREEQNETLEKARAIVKRAKAAGRDQTASENAQIEVYLSEVEAIKSQIGDRNLIQQIDDMFGGGSYGNEAAGPGSWAKSFGDQISKRATFGSKALIEPTGSVNVPVLSAGLTPLGDRVETILQLIRWQKVGDTDGYSYLRETVRTHAAAPVAVGQIKPTSVYTVERVDDRVRTIAHLTEPIPRQYLEDVRLLRQYIDGVLREGVQLELEWQIISGAGAGEDLTGLLSTVGIVLQPFDTDVLTTARRAITSLELQSIAGTAFVFHPSDWETFELVTATGGEYLLKEANVAPPVDRARRRLWGLPVALSLGIPQGTGLLVDFAGSVAGWEREDIRIDWSEAGFNAAGYMENPTSDFERNQIRFRGEGRWGFAAMRPAGVCEIELEAGS